MYPKQWLVAKDLRAGFQCQLVGEFKDDQVFDAVHSASFEERTRNTNTPVTASSARSTASLRSNRYNLPSAEVQDPLSQVEVKPQGNFHVTRILETSKRLTIGAAAKKSSDLVVVAEERDEKLGASVLKDESEIAVAAAFEELTS